MQERRARVFLGALKKILMNIIAALMILLPCLAQAAPERIFRAHCDVYARSPGNWQKVTEFDLLSDNLRHEIPNSVTEKKVSFEGFTAEVELAPACGDDCDDFSMKLFLKLSKNGISVDRTSALRLTTEKRADRVGLSLNDESSQMVFSVDCQDTMKHDYCASLKGWDRKFFCGLPEVTEGTSTRRVPLTPSPFL